MPISSLFCAEISEMETPHTKREKIILSQEELVRKFVELLSIHFVLLNLQETTFFRGSLGIEIEPFRKIGKIMGNVYNDDIY
ncbi:MAG: hypothetical protein ACI85I_001990 [Arenicella sp.]|jgi:hypothetical protein